MPAVEGTEYFTLGAPDRRLFVEFDIKAVCNEEKSKEAGRPIFEDQEYIRIIIPGDKTTAIHKAVTPEIRAIYAQQYQEWKTGGDQHATTGTPLAIWPWPGVTKSTVEELKHFKCYTVEQLAGLTDTVLARLGPGIIKLRADAREWLESAASAAPLSKMLGENETLRARVEAQEAQIKKMDAAIQRLQGDGSGERAARTAKAAKVEAGA